MRIWKNVVLSVLVLLLAMASISSAEVVTMDVPATTDITLGNVSGLGWIASPTPSPIFNRAGFAFTVYNSPVVKGFLSYVDYPARLFVLGNVTTLSVDITGNTATFSGSAKISNPQGTKVGTYTVTVLDKTKPGKGNDTFAIVLSTGYTASGVLQGGDIIIRP